ncbi:uncharacterized protein [Leptinotarsa decemlineata]|uniref:uncharacterized protein n=1 Tax=Leptinotarsa decemlineata TaxID=7539 RepID=UPI003D306B32
MMIWDSSEYIKAILLLWSIFVCNIAGNDDFIIDTDECQIPNFPAFSQESLSSYVLLDYVRCSTLDPLTRTIVENNTAFLHLRTEVLDQYYKSKDEIDCCYSYVTRNGTNEEPDIGISFSSCNYFNSTVTLEEHTVIVKCYIGADKIYENVHRPMVVTKAVKEKLFNRSEAKKLSKKKHLSVLLIVVDSISRLNLARTMRSTKKFLQDNDFVEFVGYNKIDDNTFPNFNALLTGLNQNQSYSICKPTIVGGLDQCPMIWYNFRDKGYVTAYAEDFATISTYNYRKKGFKNPPTDYYFKPYMAASDTLSTLAVDSMPYCSGPESQGERILNLAGDFSKTFKNQPYFGIFWMNTFSHNYINSPGRMDNKMTNFFKDLKQHGVLNDSMVIFLSDHGIRFGVIRQTIQGWYEERLPFNLISVPLWFQREYPEKYKNFIQNAQKLTSTYDLFLTLQEVLSLSVDDYVISNSKACRSCQSLFSHISEKRNCRQAGIGEKWCTCLGKFHKNDNEITSDMKETALKLFMQSGNFQGFTIENILKSSISRGPRRKKYLLLMFKRDFDIPYQALYRIGGNSTNAMKLIHLVRLW